MRNVDGTGVTQPQTRGPYCRLRPTHVAIECLCGHEHPPQKMNIEAVKVSQKAGDVAYLMEKVLR